MSVLKSSTTVSITTHADFTAHFGKGQDWMRGNMTNTKGKSQFCWTLIFCQTDGTIYVNFSTADLNESMKKWTLFSITSKVGEQGSAPASDEDIIIEI